MQHQLDIPANTQVATIPNNVKDRRAMVQHLASCKQFNVPKRFLVLGLQKLCTMALHRSCCASPASTAKRSCHSNTRLASLLLCPRRRSSCPLCRCLQHFSCSSCSQSSSCMTVRGEEDERTLGSVKAPRPSGVGDRGQHRSSWS